MRWSTFDRHAQFVNNVDYVYSPRTIDDEAHHTFWFTMTISLQTIFYHRFEYSTDGVTYVPVPPRNLSAMWPEALTAKQQANWDLGYFVWLSTRGQHTVPDYPALGPEVRVRMRLPAAATYARVAKHRLNATDVFRPDFFIFAATSVTDDDPEEKESCVFGIDSTGWTPDSTETVMSVNLEGFRHGTFEVELLAIPNGRLPSDLPWAAVHVGDDPVAMTVVVTDEDPPVWNIPSGVWRVFVQGYWITISGNRSELVKTRYGIRITSSVGSAVYPPLGFLWREVEAIKTCFTLETPTTYTDKEQRKIGMRNVQDMDRDLRYVSLSRQMLSTGEGTVLAPVVRTSGLVHDVMGEITVGETMTIATAGNLKARGVWLTGPQSLYGGRQLYRICGSFRMGGTGYLYFGVARQSVAPASDAAGQAVGDATLLQASYGGVLDVDDLVAMDPVSATDDPVCFFVAFGQDVAGTALVHGSGSVQRMIGPPPEYVDRRR